MRTLMLRLVAGAIICSANSAALAAEFEWKMFTIYGVADKQTEWARGFAEDVNKATDGRLNIRVFPGSEMPYKGVDVYCALSGCVANVVEIAEQRTPGM